MTPTVQGNIFWEPSDVQACNFFFFKKKDQIRLVGAEFDTYDLEVLDSPIWLSCGLDYQLQEW